MKALDAFDILGVFIIMSNKKIIGDAAKKNATLKVERFVDGIIGEEFILKKHTYFFGEPLNYLDVTAFVGARYSVREKHSDFGYYVEFPLVIDSPQELTLTVFEILAKELGELEKKDITTKNSHSTEYLVDKDELLIECCPIFSMNYMEDDFVQRNNLSDLFYKPFRILE